MRMGALACTIGAALLLTAGGVDAQPVRGPGEDAITLRKGAIRVGVSTTIADYSRRFGKDTPGRANGSAEPLGIDFSQDTLGATRFPLLLPLQSALRSVTGNANLVLNLGSSSVAAQARIQTMPIVIEAGLTNRLTIGVTVPIVRTLTEVSFGLKQNGNLGFNPARATDGTATAAAATNAGLVSQLTAARTQLQALITSCTANAAANPNCSSILANGPALQSAVNAYATGVAQVYGTSASSGGAFVPVSGSGADSAVRNRLAAFRTQLEGYGITAITATTAGPSRPTALVTPDGIQRVLTDSSFGILSSRLATFDRQSIGDIDVSLKLRLFDSFGSASDTARLLPVGVNVRQSIAGVFRIGTGNMSQPERYFDSGRGDGQNDVELASFTDIVVGRRWFTTVLARYTMQLPDQPTMRITDAPTQVFPEQFRERVVNRNLGDRIELSVAPRWIMNDVFSVGAQYLFRAKGADRYTGTFTVPTAESGLDALVALDAGTLNAETSGMEHRIGIGIGFSSVASYVRHRAAVPLEVEYQASKSVAGSGGAVPRMTIHRLQVRVYGRMR